MDCFKRQMKHSDAAIKQVIEGYAREAGVRGLEKMLHKIIRKGIRQVASEILTYHSVGIADVQEYWGNLLPQRKNP